MQIAIVDDRAEDRAELSESCRPGQFSTCLYGHLYGEHGWNGDAKLKKQSNLSIQLLFCFRCRLMLFYYSVHRNA